MIAYKSLGNNGRLGNQLFQYSALFSVGFLRGYEIGIPTGQKLSEVFQLSSTKLISSNHTSTKVFSEESFVFDPTVFLSDDNVDLHGYFQSGNYFRHCHEALRKDLVFHSHIETKTQEFLKKFDKQLLCSVHVRRGDYVSSSHYHKNLDLSYYQQACGIVKSNFPNVKFLVFSDDTDACKKVFSDTNTFEVIDINDDSTELCIMSKCQVHIIANSSFSWWGAWLSGSGAVIAPKEWFAPAGPKDWSTIYEPSWMKI